VREPSVVALLAYSITTPSTTQLRNILAIGRLSRVINAHSLADFVVNEGHDDDDGNLFLNLDLTAWMASTSTPTEVRNYRKVLEKKVAALPFAMATESVEPPGSPPLDLAN
jgi:hypothetical protein